MKRVPESSNRLAQPSTQLRHLLRSEQDGYDCKNEEKMNWLKESFEHDGLTINNVHFRGDILGQKIEREVLVCVSGREDLSIDRAGPSRTGPSLPARAAGCIRLRVPRRAVGGPPRGSRLGCAGIPCVQGIPACSLAPWCVAGRWQRVLSGKRWVLQDGRSSACSPARRSSSKTCRGAAFRVAALTAAVPVAKRAEVAPFLQINNES